MALRSLPALISAVLVMAALPALARAVEAGPSPSEKAQLDAMWKAADALDEAADPAAYRKAFEGVVAYSAKLYPEGHPVRAWMEGELVTADYLQGNIKGARDRAERIAQILEKSGAEWRDKRMELANSQVVIHLTLSEFERARDLAERVLQWRLETSGGKPSTGVAAAYSNLANAEVRNGETDAAIAHVRQAIAIDKQLSPIPPNAAPHFANLVTFLYNAGRLEEAAEAARSTQTALNGFLPANHPFLAINLNTLARILADLGRLDEAETVARSALDMANARFGPSQQTVSYLTTLANVLIQKGKAEEAEQLTRSAVAMMTAAIGSDADRTLVARETLGLALSAGGKGAEAIAELKSVADIRGQRMPVYHRDRIEGFDRLAQAALRHGDTALAASAQAAAQRLRREGRLEQELAAIVAEARLGAIEARAGGGQAGQVRVKSAIDSLDQRLALLETAGSLRSGIDRDIRTGFGWALDAAVTSGDIETGFTLAQAVLESPAGRAAYAAGQRAGSSDPRLAEALRSRQQAAGELTVLMDRQLRLAGLGAEPARIEAVEKQYQAALAQLSAANARLEALAPGMLNRERSQRLALADAKAALGDDEVLLVAASGPQRTVIMAVTKGGSAMVSAKAPADRIAGLVRSMRRSLESGEEFDSAAAAELYRQLFPAPVAALVKGKKRLLIAANGTLAALPFAALVTETKGSGAARRWLVQDHAVAVVPSIALLKTARSAREAPRMKSYLGIGAPSLAGGGSSANSPITSFLEKMPPLPSSIAELEGIGRMVAVPEQRRVLVGPAATEAALRAADLEATGVLAFATHGLMAGEVDGLDEPALVLTAGGADDGLLTASEIMRLKTNSSWVLLSACNTASGSIADSSSFSGLAQAFLQAGAQNVLASHWAVRDDAAAALSTSTIGHYVNGAEPAQALQKAMVGMIRARDPALRQPNIWASFVLVMSL